MSAISDVLNFLMNVLSWKRSDARRLICGNVSCSLPWGRLGFILCNAWLSGTGFEPDVTRFYYGITGTLNVFLCCNICVQIWYATQCIEMQLVSWILLNSLDVVAQVWYFRCSGGWVAWMGVAWMRCAQVRYIWLRFLDVMCPGMIYVVERPGCDVPRWEMCPGEICVVEKPQCYVPRSGGVNEKQCCQLPIDLMKKNVQFSGRLGASNVLLNLL